jgi:hypothetical protein
LNSPAYAIKGRRRKATRVDFLNSDTVQYLIGHYGYGAIFVIVMLESAGIPMPGETILVTAAVYGTDCPGWAASERLRL